MVVRRAANSVRTNHGYKACKTLAPDEARADDDQPNRHTRIHPLTSKEAFDRETVGRQQPHSQDAEPQPQSARSL
jgi:hypothetical protein